MSAMDHIDRLTTRQIKLGQGQTATVDATDFLWLSFFRWKPFFDGSSWYAVTRVPTTGKRVGMHRLIAMACIEKLTPADLIDHRNGNGLDNRRSNLRVATHAQNNQNRRPQASSPSGFVGVEFCPKHREWKAVIRVQGKPRVVGYFGSEIDAAIAYNAAAEQLLGRFARLNPVRLLDLEPQRRTGRPPTAWYWEARDKWCTTIDGRRITLAHGRHNQIAAEQALGELLGQLHQTRRQTVANPTVLASLAESDGSTGLTAPPENATV